MVLLSLKVTAAGSLHHTRSASAAALANSPIARKREWSWEEGEDSPARTSVQSGGASSSIRMHGGWGSGYRGRGDLTGPIPAVVPASVVGWSGAPPDEFTLDLAVPRP